MTSTKQTPADKFNAKYKLKDSDFKSPKERLDNELAKLNRKDKLDDAIDYFEKENPNLDTQTIIDCLPQAFFVPLSKIRIDDTMNRPLDFAHLLSIIRDFESPLIDAVRVYIDKNNPKVYVAWDGQHTTVALYILLCYVRGKNPDDIMIPVVLNRSQDRNVIRQSFIRHNTGKRKEGIKQELGPLDIFSQEVFSFRIDLSTNPKHILADQKQRVLEDAKLYLTKELDPRFRDGAITAPEKFINQPLHIVEFLGAYWKERSKLLNGPFDNKEITIISALALAFHNANVTLDKNDFTKMVDIFYKTFTLKYGGKYGGGSNVKLYKNVGATFEKWYAKNFTPAQRASGVGRPEDPVTSTGSSQTPYTVSYLATLLQSKGFDKLPKINIDFKPSVEQLVNL